jgi:ribosomal protein S8E
MKMSKKQDIECAKVFVESATTEQRVILLNWAYELDAISRSDLSGSEKKRRALKATVSKKTIIPILKSIRHNISLVAKASKRIMWDERSLSAKLTIVAVTIGTLGLSAESAGVALGRAVGIPLWLVIAAGGSLLALIIQELESTVHGNLEATQPI